MDIFVREIYCSKMIDILKFYQNDRLELFGFSIMPSHIHLLFRDKLNEPDKLLGNIKRYSSNQLQKEIQNNPQESRKEWLLWMMEQAAKRNSNVHSRMFWQHNNKPIELWSKDVILQKLNYIHQNPVESGFVPQPEYWKYSSADNYAGGKGVMDVLLLY